VCVKIGFDVIILEKAGIWYANLPIFSTVGTSSSRCSKALSQNITKPVSQSSVFDKDSTGSFCRDTSPLKSVIASTPNKNAVRFYLWRSLLASSFSFKLLLWRSFQLLFSFVFYICVQHGILFDVKQACSRRKLFKTPGSVNYRRMLPYLKDIQEDNNCEPISSPIQLLC